MRHVKQAFALALALLAIGCGAHRLDQAQNSFNEAARLEAGASEGRGADPLHDTSLALQNYHVARSLTDEALRKYTRSLKKDQLYGTAMMLQALSEWRIQTLDPGSDSATIESLVTSIQQQLENESVVLGTRDRVLLEALPGLYELELGMRESDFGKAGDLFESAIDTLDEALTRVDPPADHPVRIYVRLAQLGAVRSWRLVELERNPAGAESDEWWEIWIERYERYRKPLEPLMVGNPELQEQVRKIDSEFGRDGE